MSRSQSGRFGDMVRVLRSSVTRHAYFGLFIAVLAVAVATLITAYLASHSLSLSAIYTAQISNPSLLVLDIMPFAFALWGQYVGVMLAHEAGVMVMDETDELRTSNAALEVAARQSQHTDPLTGLINRTHFIETLESAIAAAHLARSRLGLLFVDMDGFSEVNEQYGAANGDRVLKSFSRRLATAMPPPAVVACMGGDSFAILVDPLPSPDNLSVAARQIERALEAPCTLESLALGMAASLGGAAYPDHAQDAFGLINAAEAAMQRAKTRGGGFELVVTRRPLRDAEMHSLSAELRAAIDGDELLLHLQPLVDMKTRRVHGLEALVRWQHPRRGLILPGDFIPRAERSGLMRDLSNWVLRRALQHVAELRRGGWPLRMSVNLSARSLLDPDFPDVLAGLLRAYDVPSRMITLEITEDTLMADQRRTLDVITRITNLGVQISIDDFGTGYSQLTYLKRLPASEIKIDRSFVQDMLVSATDLAIVQATIGLAHALNLRAVGEGVESQVQADRLALLGCDLMQGFFIGRPMPIERLRVWLDEWHTVQPAPISQNRQARIHLPDVKAVTSQPVR